MQRNCIYHIVYNRKKTALQPADKALVQIEIYYPNGKKQYLSTGVYLKAEQWDNRSRQVVNSIISARLNKSFADLIDSFRDYELKLLVEGRTLTPDLLGEYYKEEDRSASFIRYARRTANARTDISPEWKRSAIQVLDVIEELGIRTFNDLSLINIERLDNHLRSKDFQQTTIHKYHKIIKTYIAFAIRDEVFPMEKNPYIKFHVPRGKSGIRQRLDDNEMDMVEQAHITHPELERARDLFVFSMYTGIPFNDAINLKTDNLRYVEGRYWIEGLRKKSGEYYSIPLLPAAQATVEKYKHYRQGYLLPAYTLQEQNRRLDTLTKLIGLKKKLTTYVARHTAASFMLRKGVSLKVVSEILGHTNVKTTEVYARLERQHILEEIERLKELL